MNRILEQKKVLNNNLEIPVLGLGVWQIPEGDETYNAVKYALEAGYRHIDTAKIYGNERSVGKAVRESGIPREDIFITTKLWNADHGYEATIDACEASLDQLGLDYIDLYLIHWPVKELRLESWKAMEALHLEGKCRSIGVSNFMVRHLEELLENCQVVPAVNQIELSPYNYRSRLDVVEFCRRSNIALEAYSPLTRGRKLNDIRLGDIAERYDKTPAQILIRWAIDHNLIVLPKSKNERRIIENSDVFDFSISETDMAELDSFDQNLVTGWDPTTAP